MCCLLCSWNFPPCYYSRSKNLLHLLFTRLPLTCANIMCIKSLQIPFFPAIPSRKAASQGILIPRLFRYDSPSQIQIRMQIRTFRQKFLSSAAFRRFAASTFGACFLWDTIQLLPPVPVHIQWKPGQPADTSTLYHITFQHTTNNSTRICAVFYCLFTKYMFLSSPVMCAYQSPNRERKSKKVYNFSSRCYAVRKWPRKPECKPKGYVLC